MRHCYWLGVKVLLFGSWLLSHSGQASSPTVTSAQFPYPPARLTYFPKSEVILYFESEGGKVYRSSDEGRTWHPVELGASNNQIVDVHQHPYDPESAFLLTDSTTLYRTQDRGATWESVTLPAVPSQGGPVLGFHATRAGYILFSGEECHENTDSQTSHGLLDITCQDRLYYTRSAFAVPPVALPASLTRCMWSHAKPTFDQLPGQSLYCIEYAPTHSRPSGSIIRRVEDHRLVKSEDFFKTMEVVTFGQHQQVGGVIGMTISGGFFTVAVKHAYTSETDLFITVDGHTWSEAHLPESLQWTENGYTTLESTKHALLVSVHQSDTQAFGGLYRSNSNGTYFTTALEHANLNRLGLVDFERVQNIEGIVLANQVYNWQEIQRHPHQSIQKRLRTRISYDDGAHWTYLRPPNRDLHGNAYPCAQNGSWDSGTCALHLHSIADKTNIGRMYSSTGAPGLLMGVGNVGSYLLPYNQGDTFLSADGGLTWEMVREEAHMYEFVDSGAILVAIDDEKPVDHLWYSTDRGRSWQKLALEFTLRAQTLTTDPQSTSLRVLLLGASVDRSHDFGQWFTIQIDFTGLQSRRCVLDKRDSDQSDFEKWYARYLADGPDCIMGHRTSFWRLKPSAQCYVGDKFHPALPVEEHCPCTEEDFECDYNFIWDDVSKQCVANGPEVIPPGACRALGDRFMGSSGYRLVPGNTCDRDQGKRLDAPVEKICTRDNHNKPSHLPPPQETPDDQTSQGVRHHLTTLSGYIQDYFYFNQSSTIVLRTSVGEVWRSSDEGGTWTRILADYSDIVEIMPHSYHNQRMYALSENDLVLYSVDQGASFQELRLPTPPNKLGLKPLLHFHPIEPEWLLFLGGTTCPKCHTEVYFTESHSGRASWVKIDTFVQRCFFGHAAGFTQHTKETIFCLAYRNKESGQEQDELNRQKEHRHNPLQLVKITHSGQSPTVFADYVKEVYVLDKYVAWTVERGTSTALYHTRDGDTSVQARFPPNVNVDPARIHPFQTILGTVFVDVRQNRVPGAEYGALFVPDASSADYSLVLEDSNWNRQGVVDVEVVPGVNGILLANQVTNVDALGPKGQKKQIRTLISFTEGRTWQPIPAPATDAQGQPYRCDGECGLHLHGHTDMADPGSLFGVPSAPGLMLAVGNVGDSLRPYEQGNTYLTQNGGRTWREIRQGESLYEIGDHGALLVIVDDERPTNRLAYSWDRGTTWHDYVFREEPLRVSTLTTVKDSTSLRFFLSGFQPTLAGGYRTVLVQVDFSEATVGQCELTVDQPHSNDFELWRPGATREDNCHLGKQVSYWRRKADVVCSVGKAFEPPVMESTECACTRLDYECAFGYWRDDHGECRYYGQDPQRPSDCPSGGYYQVDSPYRKNPHSVCRGGVTMDDPVKVSCDEGQGIRQYHRVFGSPIVDFYFFPKSPHICIRTMDAELWVTEDYGQTWTRSLDDQDKILAIIPQPFVPQRAYFITNHKVHYYTEDRGRTFKKLLAPSESSIFVNNQLAFHPDHPDWLLYLGSVECSSIFSPECHEEAFLSKDHGLTWESINRYTRGCVWALTDRFIPYNRDLIVCEEYNTKHGSQFSLGHAKRNVVASSDGFRTRQVWFENTAHFAVIENYLVVAVLADTGHNLHVHITIDGRTFSPTHFPGNVYDINKAYTVLSSQTNSLFMHVTTSDQTGAEFGTLFTSNSNGSYYTTSLDYVNRNNKGLVDFEKMQGIEGIALLNQVRNPKEVLHGSPKQLRSMISFDDGAHWQPLSSPGSDAAGHPYDCPGCSLHLQSFTVRQDPENIFSSSSAVGLMVGVGNVGHHLLPYRDGDTFLTRDAGLTWKEIRKGAHLHEFGDHGSILVLVDDEEPTDHLWYSFDEGDTFSRYVFARGGTKQRVIALTTEPQSTSRHFLLLGMTDDPQPEFVVTTLDFTTMAAEQCNLDINHEETDDFELWSPSADRDGQCLFGREVQYYRRIQGKACYIGHEYEATHTVVKNCTCTQADFECDYNFVRDPDSQECVLVVGLEAPSTECTEDQTYRDLSSGYRKIPYSSCVGGLALDTPNRVYCPATAARVSLMWVILLPLGLIGAVLGYVLYTQKRHQLPIRVTLRTLPRLVVLVLQSIDWYALVRLPQALWERLRGQYVRYSPLQQEDTGDLLMENYGDYFDNWDGNDDLVS
ncbi:vacuolar protein sorting/targeting protein PEP1 [Dispira simplex]|nr:vacuolar protein sorting/targeting protein PEP1 [Dispira simplex]